MTDKTLETAFKNKYGQVITAGDEIIYVGSSYSSTSVYRGVFVGVWVYSNGTSRVVVKPYQITPYYLYNGEYQDYVQIMNQVVTKKYPYGLKWGTPEYKEARDAYNKQQRELTNLIETLEREDRTSLQSARVLELNRVFKFVP